MREADSAGRASVSPLSVGSRPSSPNLRDRGRALGAKLGGLLAALALAFVLVPGQEHWSAPGSMNAGHGELACSSCHRRAPGTLRQQIQANVRYALGLRETPADFGHRAVRNRDCVSCHERPFDRHPVSRFLEPRFASARRALSPEQCVSCHREHSGARVTAPVGACVQCHDRLSVAADPLDVPHAALVRDGRWNTCLGCHDFHGNHRMQTPTRLRDAAPEAVLTRYFGGGPSPYPAELRRRADETRARGDDE